MRKGCFVNVSSLLARRVFWAKAVMSLGLMCVLGGAAWRARFAFSA